MDLLYNGIKRAERFFSRVKSVGIHRFNDGQSTEELTDRLNHKFMRFTNRLNFKCRYFDLKGSQKNPKLSDCQSNWL